VRAAWPRRPAAYHTARYAFVAAVVLAAAALGQHVWAKGRAEIAMKNVAFTPAQVTVQVGDTVAWDNADIVAHTATSTEAGFDLSVAPGGKASAILTRPGTFAYLCRYHPNMRGQIVVKP
jgi:plastocyanin